MYTNQIRASPIGGRDVSLGEVTHHSAWLSHDIIANFCMVYGIQKGGQWASVYCEMGTQQYCNSVGFASGGGAIKG